MNQWIALADIRLDSHYRQLPDHLYHEVGPEPLPDPRIISTNHKVAEQLGIDPCSLDPQLLAQWLGGHQLPPGSNPLAMKYAGHQFGVYNPQLGDGRGLLLGELVHAQEHWDLHLKGAGHTRYSRMGDGRAVLRSSIREYLVGEALTALNIPSTRALALCATSLKVRREMVENAATILRVSRCHVRFGHFEHLYYSRQHEALRELADYCLQRFYPQCLQAEDPVLAMFRTIGRRSAAMVAGWQAYGFLHGVMNTDNMSILGETFDHGPFAFIDTWKENAVYNHTDELGRYAFSKQPDVVHWNLSALAQALLPLTTLEGLKAALDEFPEQFKNAYQARMRERLGLASELPGDEELISHWRSLLNQYELDYNPLYRALALAQTSRANGEADLDELELIPWLPVLQEWLPLYRARLQQEQRSSGDRKTAMLAVNPAYTLRTHVAQHIIDAAEKGDYAPLNQWLQVLQNPFVDHPGLEDWKKAPQGSGFVMLSCSS
ncbi:protein adenylyltransferase SelO [Parathalassolituus penaei]|uniref:Protein nucleotidyltransferase YdiU n=1 Tax=Parathalassolituus penaei TaxID=2997323 RepID=A0A9X3EGH7_9GAMM|nr:YdiU family protein [Parathalassolituus penaei]MCY0967142.1 YdiU family protein [Parathalassolituus penaei]